MSRHRRDSKRRGQPSPGAPSNTTSGAPGYTWYDPDEGKLHGEKKSSFKARWVTHAEATHLKKNRERTRRMQRNGFRKSRKHRYTPKGQALRKLTKLVYELCTLLKAPQRRGGQAPVYHEPEMSLKFFWATIEAMVAGKHTWSHWEISAKGTGYNHVRTIRWDKVAARIGEIEDLIWSWGFHRYYGVRTLWLDKGIRFKDAISSPDRHELITTMIEELPPSPDTPDEYKSAPLTERSK